MAQPAGLAECAPSGEGGGERHARREGEHRGADLRLAALQANGHVLLVRSCAMPRVDAHSHTRLRVCCRSAPVAPVANTVKALRGEAFHRVVHDGNCSEYLKAIQGAPVVSENILLCGMRLVGAHRSYVQDRNIRARGLLGPPYVNGGERDYDQDLAPAARAPGMLPARNPFELGARTVNLHDYSL